MEKKKELKVKLLLGVFEFLEKHPLLVKIFLRPIANAPIISKKMMVMIRAYMGSTAFEIHDVDLSKGRIGIGGVEEIMFGSKIVELLHTTLADRLGTEEKNKTLYDIGYNLCKWEVSQALEGGKWAPKLLVPLIANSEIMDEVRKDELMGRFFEKVLSIMSRLITNEGGWGHLEFDVSSFPVKVKLSNSQEANWLGESDESVCHLYAGIVAGYASAISGKVFHAKEIACKAMGDPKCIFEIIE